MKINIYGAGSIGGHMAMRLHQAGADISILARGATLKAIKDNGLQMTSGQEHFVAHVPASDEPEDLPKPDVIIVAVKSHHLASIADRLKRLAGPDTPVVFALNGLPWWYRQVLRKKADKKTSGMQADEKALVDFLSVDQVIGCTVGSANSVRAPGHIMNEMPSPNRFIFGSVNPALEPVCSQLATLITNGGAKGMIGEHIDVEIWKKLQLNLITNSFGCLTGLDSHALLASEELHPLAERMLADTRKLASVCGVTLDPSNKILDPSPIPNHKTSMLQDMEKGISLEYNAVFGAALQVADWFDIDVPSIQFAAGLLHAKAKALDLIADE